MLEKGTQRRRDKIGNKIYRDAEKKEMRKR